MLGIEWYVVILGVVIAMSMAVVVYLTARILWWFMNWIERT